MSVAARAAAFTFVVAGALPAQQPPAPRAEERAREERDAVIWPGESGLRIFRSDEQQGSRAVLGLSTSSGGERDTLGLLITSITPNGPADRAGLEEGNRIASINGTNLRLSPADAGEPDMRGLVSRRLTRELGKVKAGDQVELRVWQNGQYRNLRVRTVAADSLPGRRLVGGLSREERSRERERRMREREERAVLGLDLQPSGSRRDTLGVLITRVIDGSPAERAGLVEGDRVAAVNGVDLRVSRDDAGDSWVSNAKSNRFSREMQRVKPGGAVELRVYSGGQFKTVRVTAARAGDVYKEGRNNFLFRSAGMEGELFEFPLPPLPPLPPEPPMPPVPMGHFDIALPRIQVELNTDEIGRRVEDALRRVDGKLHESGERLRTLGVGRGAVYRI